MSTKTASRPDLSSGPTAFKLLRADVVGVRSLSPNLTRITFGGPEVASMTSGGLDQRIKVVLPRPGQREPVLPEYERSYQALRALPDEDRPICRTYTVRAHRPEPGEFDVDFALHGAAGPGSAFAVGARVGDRVAVYVPNAEFDHGPRLGGVEYRLDLLRNNTLLVGDETAVPAIASILEELPSGVRAQVYVELPDLADAQMFSSRAELEVHWFVRQRSGRAMLGAISAAPLPGQHWYAWIAGESSMVKPVRRLLVQHRAFDRESITFMGYWRQGQAEGTSA